ncbi:MAG: NAD(P)/FAD-dependent oxidoreductase [Dehalococcoidia bacterium]|nr:NAD(P)/FAD-dependent oxidoreductase [Dehalococcoidia bacterium]
MKDSYDVIIIGAGIAGLACSIRLARAGKTVLLVERRVKPGGYCTSFARKGITFEPGPHWVLEAERMNRFIEDSGGEPVDFLPLRSIFRAVGPNEGTDIILTRERTTFRETVRRSYPGVKAETVDGLLDLALRVDDDFNRLPSVSPEMMPPVSRALFALTMPFKMRAAIRFGRVSADRFLDSRLPGESLKGLRTALHSLTPAPGVPAAGLLAWLAIGLRGKARAPRGGVQKISDALAATAEKNGVDILYHQAVVRIKIRSWKAAGVLLEDGSDINARFVVSAVDARQTFEKLIGREMVHSSYMRKFDAPVSESALSISIVTDLDPAKYGFDGTDTFVNSACDYDQALAPDRPDTVVFRMSFPTLSDPSKREEDFDPNLHGVHILTGAFFDYEDYWKAGPDLRRGEEYREFKKETAFKLIKRAEKYLPGLSDHIVDLDISTPLTYHRYTLNHQGASRGWRDFGFWKQKTPSIGNLYRAGHWVVPMGVHSAFSSGITAAELVLNRM